MAKAIEKDYDKKGFEDALKLSVELRAKGIEKKAGLLQSENIYMMRYTPKKGAGELKKMISPDGKNKTKGAVRLLTAGVPHFSVPREKNNPDVEKVSSDIEQMAQTMWLMSNHIQGMRVERDLALSGFIYDEMILNIICLDDVIEGLQRAYDAATDKYDKMRWNGRLKLAQANADLTPYMFEVASPMVWFPKYGRFGMEMCYSEVSRVVSDVLMSWGEDARDAVMARKDTDMVTECTLSDSMFKYVWLAENKKVPIFAKEHGASGMTTVAVRAEGSRLFEKTEDQYDPFLKTLAVSGLWDFQNGIMTATRTNLDATLNAQWDFTQGSAGDEITIDHSKIAGVVSHPPNSSLKPMMKDVLSKDVFGALELVRALISDSTIYDQALGAQTGQKDPYALVSLLSQAGRLPLIGVQSMLGELGAKVMEATFAWMKANKKGRKVQARYGKDLELSMGDIPATIRFECKVDVDLPQDKLAQANIAGMLQKSQLASDEWIQTNVLSIENPDQVRKQIFKETATKVMGGKVVEQLINQMMTPPAPPAPPPSGNPSGPGAPVPTDPRNPQGPADPRAGMNMPVQGGLPPAMAGPMPQQPPDMQMPPEGMPPEMMEGGL